MNDLIIVYNLSDGIIIVNTSFIAFLKKIMEITNFIEI